jgi:hypothetical protein
MRRGNAGPVNGQIALVNILQRMRRDAALCYTDLCGGSLEGQDNIPERVARRKAVL